MALADTLNLPKTAALLGGQGMPKTPKNYVGLSEKSPVVAELTEAQVKAEKDIGMADIGIKRAEQEQKIKDLEGQQVLAQKAAKDIRALPEREVLKTKREEFAEMTFAPTKDNAQDLASLFSLVNVIGMAVGGGGKQNAQQAMYAMNGMLEGYQKGRADLYRKEKDSFDKNFKAMQEAVKTLEKDYEEAVKMYQYDKEAGEIARKLALARSGSPLFKAMEDRVGMVGTLSAIKELRSSVDKGAILQNNLQAKADAEANAERRSREAMAQRDRIARENRISADERARLNRLDKEGKLSPAERKEVRGINNLSDEIQRLKDTFKPEFVNFKADVLGDVAAKVRSRIADDPAMAEWWRRYENVALPERHAMFGATLTGKEQESWRKASIGTGNSTKEVLSWIADKEQALNNKLSGYETTAASRPSQPTQGQYQIDQIITQGNKRYRIVGLDDPNDPDVEEVK
jgi:hypothetical protein